MIAVCYTGQNRFNVSISEQNHQLLISELKNIGEVVIYDFCNQNTKNPYKHSGAIQVWQLLDAVQSIDHDIVIRLRKDLWLEQSAVDSIIKQVVRLVSHEIDLAFFGSDIANGLYENSETITGVDDHTLRVQDLAILINKQKLDIDHLLEKLDAYTRPHATGNELFMLLIKGLKTVNVVCPIWLIRRWYDTYPTDKTVCVDHVQSYLKENNRHILETVLEWAENK